MFKFLNDKYDVIFTINAHIVGDLFPDAGLTLERIPHTNKFFDVSDGFPQVPQKLTLQYYEDYDTAQKAIEAISKFKGQAKNIKYIYFNNNPFLALFDDWGMQYQAVTGEYFRQVTHIFYLYCSQVTYD